MEVIQKWTHKGVEIKLYSDAKFGFVINGKHNSTESLAGAKKQIDKEKAAAAKFTFPFDAVLFARDVDSWRKGKGVKKITVTGMEMAERAGRRGAASFVFLCEPKNKNDYIHGRQAYQVFPDTAEAIAAYEESMKLEYAKTRLERDLDNKRDAIFATIPAWNATQCHEAGELVFAPPKEKASLRLNDDEDEASPLVYVDRQAYMTMTGALILLANLDAEPDPAEALAGAKAMARIGADALTMDAALAGETADTVSGAQRRWRWHQRGLTGAL